MRPAPTSPCAGCPVGPDCPAILRGHGPYCDHFDPTHPGYSRERAEAMARRLREKAGVETAAPPPTPALSDERARLAVLVDLCPDRLSCQCREPIECRAHGPGTLARCLECRRAASPA